MTAAQRRWLILPVCLAVGGLLLWGLAGLPAFGDFHGAYGRLLIAVGVSQRHTSNIVAAVTFDYRGFDTLGEEFILFTSAMGVAFLLRGSKRIKEQKPPDRVHHDALRVTGMVMVPVTILLGLWLAAYGYVTPGGGFQGGVVLGSAVALIWAASSYRDYHALTPQSLLDGLEGAGASGYVLVGVAGLAISGAYLTNVLGLGTSGTLLSGGSIGLLNGASAIEVAAANVLIYREFLIEYIEIFPGVQEE